MSRREHLFADSLKQLSARKNLSAQQIEELAQLMFEGEISQALLEEWLLALREKGETGEEVSALARVMRQRATSIPVKTPGPLIDVCGTGGDELHTFNISTAVALVVASCGIAVAKHGNRSVSSRSGSADLLETLDIKIALSADAVARCISELGIGFLFAPHYHAAMKFVAPARTHLAVRTIFNLVGPLANPAPVTHQLIGVYNDRIAHVIADAALVLNLRGAWIVHAENGMDELSPEGKSEILVAKEKQHEPRSVSADDFGLPSGSLADLKVDGVDQSAAMVKEVLAGKAGAARTAVLMNAAAALVLCGNARDLKEGMRLAEHALDSGAAIEKLRAWVELSNELS